MKILLIDNYDSFTWNLFHLIKSVCGDTDVVDVKLNDKINTGVARRYDKIIISPGAGIPSDTGEVKNIIKELSSEKSILGICLGHQAIAEVFGATVCNIEHPAHGVKSRIHLLNTDRLFKGLSTPSFAARYHSWLVSKKEFPEVLKITATDSDGNIMALSHCLYDVHGLQFHPESIMTDSGKQIMNNFING